jgi:hypothetical protein
MANTKRNEEGTASERLHRHLEENPPLGSTVPEDMSEQHITARTIRGGKEKDIILRHNDGIQTIEIGSTKLELDKDACLKLAKVASRAAQTLA